jgi:APA family basic amino acid/polyamine antiporter
VYVITNIAYLNVLPFQGVEGGTDVLARGIQHATQDRVGTAAMESMIGPLGAILMAVAILISTFGCNNGLILAGARVYYAMARDALFFRRAGTLHPEYRTPVFALVTQAVWTMVLCVSGTYGELLNYVVFAALLFYALTAVALFRLRKIRPDVPRPVKAFGYPVLPALYVVATTAVMIVLLVDPQQRLYSGLGLLLVLVGVPVYGVWRRTAR